MVLRLTLCWTLTCDTLSPMVKELRFFWWRVVSFLDDPCLPCVGWERVYLFPVACWEALWSRQAWIDGGYDRP